MPAEIVIDVLTPLVFCSVHVLSQQHLFLPIRQQPVAAEAITAPTSASLIIPINFFMLFPFVFRPKNPSPAYVRNMIIYFPHLFDLEYNENERNTRPGELKGTRAHMYPDFPRPNQTTFSFQCSNFLNRYCVQRKE